MTSDAFRELLTADPFAAARRMLGSRLVSAECAARIVEVEVYLNATDPGSHAHRGPGKRNATMYARPGVAYVYFTYGNHWMLCVTSLEEGVGSAILIRAAVPLSGQAAMRERRGERWEDKDLLRGPGRLCQAFGIDGAWEGVDMLAADSRLRLELNQPVDEVLQSVRIGIAVGKGENLPWRYVSALDRDWASGRAQLAPYVTSPG